MCVCVFGGVVLGVCLCVCVCLIVVLSDFFMCVRGGTCSFLLATYLMSSNLLLLSSYISLSGFTG